MAGKKATIKKATVKVGKLDKVEKEKHRYIYPKNHVFSLIFHTKNDSKSFF